MIAAGKTDDEIRTFMIERYGDFVLYRPRMTAGNFLLWAAPVLLLAFGAFAVVRVVRQRSAESDIDPAGPEVKVSTRRTRPYASPICPPALLSPAKTRSLRSKIVRQP